MIAKPFKEIKKFDLIINGKINHYFRITFLNNEVCLFDNYGKKIPRNKYNEHFRGKKL